MKFNRLAFLGILLNLVMVLSAGAQSIFPALNATEAKTQVTQLARSASKAQKISILLQLASYHLQKPGEKKADLDSCQNFIKQAIKLSHDIGDLKSETKANIINAILIHERSDTKKAKLELAKIIKYAETQQQFNEKGRALFELGVLNRFEDQYPYFEQALAAFRKGNDQIAIGKMLIVLSDREMAAGRFEQAYRWLLEAIKYEQSPRAYVLLAGVTNYYRDQTESLRYGLLGVEVARKENNLRAEAEAYAGVGEIYRLLHQDQQAVEAFQTALNIMAKLNMFPGYYDVARGLAYTYLDKGKAMAAIDSYRQNMARFPPTRNIDQFRYNTVLTNLYVRANDFKNAKFHLESAKDLVPKGENPDGIYSLTRTAAEYYFRFGELDKARLLYQHGNKVSGEKVDHLLRIASIDSINGDYQSAFKYSQRAKKLNDSLLSETRSKVVAGLQIRFDLKQKESNLLIKDATLKIQNQQIQVLAQKALLLHQQAEISKQDLKLNATRLTQAKLNTANNLITIKLKDQNIQLLNRENTIQSNQLKQEAQTKKITLALILLSIIVIVLLVRQYRIKQKNNDIITEKNVLLEQLVQDKSWLLKEMHHRVKNNLHTVMSLLESQSAYLNNDALAAVQNSQHRIFAMSLIHQKLYQSDDITTINMALYIPELVNYLKEFIPKDKHIVIKTDIVPIEFNIGEAVPLGLIVNEVITNSIKYAFTGKDEGLINLSLSTLPNGAYQLLMSDNGIGLPSNFNIDLSDSLGLKLIKGLSKQLGVELLIKTDHGTIVCLKFPAQSNSDVH